MVSHWSILFIGEIVATILLLAAVAQSLWYCRGQLREGRGYADAVERLEAIATGLSGKLGSGQELLDELASAAGQICGMSHVMICVLEIDEKSGEKILRRVAAVRWPAEHGPTFLMRDLPSIRQVVTEGRTIVASNTAPQGHSLGRLHKAGLASMVLVPLSVEHKVIGVLSLCDACDHVTAVQERLARLWGAQASVILAQERLYERTQAALAVQRRLTEQRERLSAITATIYAQKTFESTLQSVVQLVPPLINVDGGVVMMCVDSPADLLMVAGSPPHDRLVGLRIKGDKQRMQQRFVQRVAAVVADSNNDPNRSPMWDSIKGVGSYISVPLFHSDQRPLGLLILLRRKKGEFARDQLQMAQVFAARAAAAIENARLHQQARADARTNAMLLRELNHRVKNNLAGIAGLLEAADSEVSDASRPVVARLARRVRVMADAHQLFIGGVTAISVTQLVEQVLASVAVAREAGSRIEMNLDAAKKVRLRTDRAVSLAMVLHELTYNAVFHGCGPAGRLTINGVLRTEPAATLLIEVIDDGSAAAGGKSRRPVAFGGPESFGGNEAGVGGVGVVDAVSGTGIGLELVRGLVRRELQGQLELESLPQGGTRAAVEFPVAADELREPSS